MLLISIIIPVYNAEKYIRKCLDSIIAQTYTCWEAILVDDGSLDNSGAICDEYARKDQRFKVIHQQNGGVSVARQTGLDHATGNYIIHCDPDDWVEPNMLEELLNCAVSEGADMVICDFIEEHPNKSTYISQGLPDNVSAEYVKSQIIKDKLHGSCWNKLLSRACIGNIGFRPPEITLCEDELFNIRVLCQDIKVIYLPKAFYHYNINNNDSICHSTSTKTILSKKLVITECEKLVDKEKFNDLYDMKKAVLNNLFTTNNLKELQNTYREIHEKIIKGRVTYHFFTPLGFFIKKALKGSPSFYHTLYRINIWCITTLQKVKHFFNRK